MIKEKINSNKGITLVSLVVTIVILLVLSTISIFTIRSSNNIGPYNNMVADITLLEEKVSNYYLKYGDLPIVRNDANDPITYSYKEIEFDSKPNENEKYYIIDLQAMEGITLNYGLKGFNNLNTSDDVYIINERTHNIYYPRGIEIDGEKYYYIADKNIQQTKIKLADVITPENYGDVIEYEANGVKDWKIFFNDGNNVFIITSKYIPDTSIPENSNMISGNTYKITWEPIYGALRPGFEGHAPIVTDITENSKILERAQTFKYEWIKENVDKDWNKVAAAKDLLNNDVWNVFAEGLEGAQAIGAPTLEMFAESWKQKEYGELTYSYNENGYSIGDNGAWLSLARGEGYQDTLYFPYQLNSSQEDIEWANSTQCVAYWLATASSKDNHSLLCLDGYGGMFPDWYSAFYIGLRPVVCLPSAAAATIEEGVWTNLTAD